MQQPGRPHRVLIAASALTLLASTVMVLVGAFKIGVTTDEPFHVQRYENYRSTGWYLADFQMDGDEPGPQVDDQYVYAPAAMTVLNVLGAVAGTDDVGEVGTDLTAYRLRHLGVALLGLLGVAAVTATVRIVLKSWHWGLVAGAALAAMPLWTALAMFNVKDTPVATGFALATLGLVLVARPEPGNRWLRFGAPAVLAVGIFLAVGTRPGMWAGVLPGLVIALALSRPTRHRLLEIGAGLAIALVALGALYPRVFLDPTWPYRAVSSSSQFGIDRVKRSYVPLHVLVDLPMLLTALGCAGAVAVLIPLVRKRARGLDLPEVGGIILLAQAGSLPVTTLFHQTALQNDLRQLLFVGPPAAALAAVGVAVLTKHGRILGGTIAAAALLLPLADQAALFPYNYVWSNPLNDLRAPTVTDNRDYMGGSFEEVARAAGPVGRIICNKQAGPAGPVPTPPMRYDNADCPTFDPRSRPRDRRVDLTSPVFWPVGMRQSYPGNCETVAQVTRLLHGRRVVISSLGRCRRQFTVLSTRLAPVAPEAPGATGALAAGWELPEEHLENAWGQPGARAAGASASLVFKVPPGSADSDILLVLGTTTCERSRDLTATVDGIPATVWCEEDGARVALGHHGDSPVLVILSGSPLQFALTALGVEPDLRNR